MGHKYVYIGVIGLYKTVVVNRMENGVNDWDTVDLFKEKYHDLSKHLNRYGLMDFVGISQVPPNTPYVVYLRVYYDFYDHGVPLYAWCLDNNSVSNVTRFDMPERVWNDSANGLVYWIVEWHTESDTYERMDFRKLINGLNVKDPSKIAFLTAAETRWGMSPQVKRIETDYGIKVYHSNILFNFARTTNDDGTFVEGYGDFIQEKTKSLLDKKHLPYKNVCYNRQPRFHRMIILAHLHANGMLDRTIYSLGGDAPRYTSVNEYTTSPELCHLTPLYEYYANLPYQINTQFGEELDLHYNHAMTLCLPHALNSYFHVVTETAPHAHTFITEKSYKPFMYMQPFIQFGNYQNVEVLRKLGYVVFDDEIDHSYDNEPNNVKRMVMFLKEYDRLYNIPDHEWVEKLYRMTEGLHHNMSLASMRQEHNPSKYLLKDIHKHVNR